MKLMHISASLYLIAAFIFLSCNKDDDPKVTKVFGTITIENINTWAEWIDSGEVQVTVFPPFSLNPPAGWGPVPDNAFGPGVPGGTFPVGAPYNSQNPVVLNYEPGKNSFTYEIELEPGTYSALAIGFNHYFITDSNRSTASLGVHWNNPAQVSHGVVIKIDVGGGNIVPIFNEMPPSAFTINEGEVLEIDIMADFNFVLDWYR
jgi:hypothetical protein